MHPSRAAGRWHRARRPYGVAGGAHHSDAPTPARNGTFPPSTGAALSTRFSARRAAYVLRTLTPSELAVIADLADVLIVARIKRLPDGRLRRFDQMFPYDSDQQLYRTLQLNWLRDEEYLLGSRPTPKKLFIDFMNNQYGLPFRAYFALKHPGRVRRTRPSCARA